MKNLLFKCCTLVISMLIIVSCSDDFDTPIDNRNVDGEDNSSSIEFVDQNSAIKSFKNLMLSFESQKTKSVNTDYPDYYGGSYIDENANLVVYVTNEALKTKSSLPISSEENIIIESCEYSFNELHAIKKAIGDFRVANTNNSISDNIVFVSIRDIDNRIKVGLLDNSINQIEEFKKTVIDSPAITFEKVEERIKPYTLTTAYPGSGLLSPIGMQTLGYRASRYGKTGYVTTAHGVNYNASVSVNGYLLGKCTERQYSGSVDAAFCEEDLLTSVSYSTQINGSHLSLSSSIVYATAGMAISKSGNTTGITSGSITSTSTDVTFEYDNVSVHLTDIVETTLVASKGDSGGTTFYNSGWQADLLGIVAGGAYYTYIIKASNIASALGCQIY